MLYLLLPTPARFASEVARRVRQAGARVRSVHPDTLTLACDDGKTIDLADAFKGFCAQGLGARKGYLDRLIPQLLDDSARLTGAWAHDSRYLLPVVHSRLGLVRYLLTFELDQARPGTPSPALVPVGQALTAFLGFELNQTLSFSPGFDLTLAYQVSSHLAWEKALQNLRAHGAPDWKEPRPGLYVSQAYDGQSAAWMLIPGLAGSLGIQGRALALSAHPGHLVLLSDQRPELIPHALELTHDLAGRPGAHFCTVVAQADNGQWSDFEPPAQHPFAGQARRFNAQARAWLYDSVQELVERVLKHRGLDTSVQAHQASGAPGAGPERDYVVWEQGVSCLLPVCGTLVLRQPGQPDCALPWEKALPLVRGLLTPAGLPLDYAEPRGFPDAQTLAALWAASREI